MNTMSAAAAGAWRDVEHPRGVRGRFVESGRGDPGQVGLGASREENLRSLDHLNALAPRKRVDRFATLDLANGRSVRLEIVDGMPRATVYLRTGSSRRSARVGWVSTGEVYAYPDGWSMPTAPMAELGFPDDWDDGPNAQRADDAYRDGLLNAAEAGELKDFVRLHAPGHDGLTHELDTAQLRAMSDEQLADLREELEQAATYTYRDAETRETTTRPDSDDYSIGEAIALRGAIFHVWGPNTASFPSMDNHQIQLSPTAARAYGHGPAEPVAPSSDWRRWGGPDPADEPPF